MREIKIHISPDLEDKSSPVFPALPHLRQRLTENQSSIHTDPPQIGIEGRMTFRRFVKARYDTAKKMYIPLPEDEIRWEEEGTIVLFVTAKKLAELVLRERQGVAQIDDGVDQSLHAWFCRVRARSTRERSNESTILVVHGLKAYHGKTASAVNRDFAERARGILEGGGDIGVDNPRPKATNSQKVSKEEMEMALCKLHLVEKCFQIQGWSSFQDQIQFLG